ncbi:MAG: hypothetical protein KDD04_10500, partial [Sinomicrobium sp.]|nr:hypothetical protein [Sinomicrobium sp.]
EMGNGGYAALMHDLLNWEITSDLRTPPDTHAKAQQKKLAARLEDEWIYECLCEGKWRSVQDGWERDQVKKDLYHAFTQYAGERGIGFRPSPQALGMSLSKIFGDELRIGKVKALYYEDNGGYSQEVWKWVNGYTFPDLERSRALYDAYSGLNEAWPEIHEEETVF